MLKADIQLRLSRLDLDAAFSVESGEVVALLGPERVREVDHPAGPDGPAAARRGPGGAGRHGPGRPRPAHQGPAGEPAHRPDVPGLPAVPAPERGGERGVRPAGPRAPTRRPRGRGRRRRWPGWAWRAPWPRPARARCPAASSSAWRMARALVTEPKLLLLDEPLAALDVSTKTDVRRLLREALRHSEAANVLVTHDLLDAVALGDRMVVIGDGKIVQTGTPAEVTVASPLPLRRRPGRRQPAAGHRPRHGAGRRRRRAARHRQSPRAGPSWPPSRRPR